MLLALSFDQTLSNAEPSVAESTAYSFDGQLGYRSTDGLLVPVVPDVVLVGWGEGRCQFTLQSPKALEVDADGRFRLFLEESSRSVERIVVMHPDGSVDEPTCVEDASWPCYRFRAAGCGRSHPAVRPAAA
jgi:hypothetical protein